MSLHFGSSGKARAEILALLRRIYRHNMNAFEGAKKSGKTGELHHQLLELAKSQNESTDGGTSIPATFLRVTVSL